jgi:3-dehydroquinate synthase
MVHVSASREYDVMVERGLLPKSGQLIKNATGAKKAVIIAGDIVYPLYGDIVKRSLESAGIETLSFILPHGEQHKNLDSYGKILQFLSENHLTRTDTLVALGGGVTGDITGFAAATYQRGMSFVQIPTTLLAAVDSSVGGKTAVNLPTGKNQVGSFYQPSLVICDPDTLSTLSDEEFRCGCAEVIKYGVLGNKKFFEELKATPIKEQLEHVICTCVEMKRDLVNKDEFDRGLRQLLNLGHSFGHSVEACSHFTVLHGQAVAIGMAIITRAAVNKGYCEESVLTAVLDILKQYDLPTSTDFKAEEMYLAALSDKKLTDGSMHLVVPVELGHCNIIKVPTEEIKDWLLAGGIAP